MGLILLIWRRDLLRGNSAAAESTDFHSLVWLSLLCFCAWPRTLSHGIRFVLTLGRRSGWPLYFRKTRAVGREGALTHRLLRSLGNGVRSTAVSEVYLFVVSLYAHLDCYLGAHMNNAGKRALSYLFVTSDPISKSVIIRFLQFTHPPAIAASQQHNTQGV